MSERGGGEEKDQTDAPTQQAAVPGGEEIDGPTHQDPVPKKEDFVLEKEIIDVSYFCNIRQATALKPVKLVAKSDHYGHATSITTAN